MDSLHIQMEVAKKVNGVPQQLHYHLFNILKFCQGHKKQTSYNIFNQSLCISFKNISYFFDPLSLIYMSVTYHSILYSSYKWLYALLYRIPKLIFELISSSSVFIHSIVLEDDVCQKNVVHPLQKL